MGNEYFARDLYASNKSFEGLPNSPAGMVTYSSGAFMIGSGGFLHEPRFYSKYIIPADWHNDTYKTNSIPAQTLQAKTIYEEIAPMITGYNQSPDQSSKCDDSMYECRSVVVFNHYAKGADRWRTISNPLAPIWDAITHGTAYVMDSTPSYEAKTSINKYFENNNPLGKRKRFPAVFTVYFAGLDHEAHDKGMGEYKKFFKVTTDAQVKEVIDALKEQDEFDNKIFVIIADHGMTEMPTDLPFKLRLKKIDPEGHEYLNDGTYEAESSCKLNLAFSNDLDGNLALIAQNAEKNNNNLHIWELGEVFALFPSPEIEVKVVAPEQIAVTTKGATSDINTAKVVAALNGPMAHIYIKGNNWQGNPDSEVLGIVLERLLKIFKEGSSATGSFGEKLEKHFPRLKRRLMSSS
jgi:hypothetical protein